MIGTSIIDVMASSTIVGILYVGMRRMRLLLKHAILRLEGFGRGRETPYCTSLEKHADCHDRTARPNEWTQSFPDATQFPQESTETFPILVFWPGRVSLMCGACTRTIGAHMSLIRKSRNKVLSNNNFVQINYKSERTNERMNESIDKQVRHSKEAETQSLNSRPAPPCMRHDAVRQVENAISCSDKMRPNNIIAPRVQTSTYLPPVEDGRSQLPQISTCADR